MLLIDRHGNEHPVVKPFASQAAFTALAIAWSGRLRDE